MMGPHVYEEARAEAPIHVQLVMTRRPRRRSGADSVRVSARIVRVFRDRERQVHVGQRVTFFVPVINREPAGPPEPSGTIHHDWERMGRARWLEAFLRRWDGEFDLVRDQVAAIRHPTWRPVCGPDVKGFVCLGNFEALP